MIKKIPTAALRPGMYVADTGLDELKPSALYSTEGEITKESHIRELCAQGYLQVFVDTDKGSYIWPDHSGKSPEREVHDGVIGQQADQSCPLVPLAEEIPKAKAVYDAGLTYIKVFMGNARKGKVDYKAAQGLVEDILCSVGRNHDALISLTKLKSWDEYTFTHCINVSVLATAFGSYLGLPQDVLRELATAALFHDVGKALVPPAILNKPGKLTDKEFEVIKKHPENSSRLLHEEKGIPKQVLRGVTEHHEKFNGAGYPGHLAGDDIHPFARIIAVADVYDALTSRRGYKPPMMPSRAMTILYGMRGKDFHPGKAETFIKFLGIYPVGSMVRLNSGEHAIVVASNPDSPLNPTVLIAFDEEVKPISRRRVDLAAQEGKNPLQIEESVDHEPFGVDPAEFLGVSQ